MFFACIPDPEFLYGLITLAIYSDAVYLAVGELKLIPADFTIPLLNYIDVDHIMIDQRKGIEIYNIQKKAIGRIYSI